MPNKNRIHILFRDSSFLHDVTYDAQTRVGLVTMNCTLANPMGETYRVADLPVGVVAAWACADSAGVYYNSEVKGKFKHERASWTTTR